MIPALMAAVALALLALIALGNRPHSVVTLGDGRAEQIRGDLPPALVSDFKDIARRRRDAAGRVEIRGEGETLDVKTKGLDDQAAQRVRNVVMVRRKQIRRPR